MIAAAPASSAARATAAFTVSTVSSSAGWRRTSASTTGTHPRQLDLLGTGSVAARPGRFAADVDASRRPPRAARRACASAPSRPVNRPPSLKLSGVTLRMPMSTGRSSATRAAGGLPDRRRLGGHRESDVDGQSREARAAPATDGRRRSGASGCRRATAQSSPVRTSRPSVPDSRTRASRAPWSSPVRWKARG